jgi:hypothetical protein
MSKSYVSAILGAALLLSIGCAGPGEEKNYKELEREDAEPFQTERDPLFGSRPGSVVYAALDEQPGQVIISIDQEAAPRVDPPPSLTGLDRSHWPTLFFSPADGRTVHNPTYFTDVDVERDRMDLARPDITARAEQALTASEPENYSGRNVADLFVEPVWTIAQLGLLPAMMIVQPPLAKVTTP